MKKSAKLNFDKKDQSLYVNNIDLQSINNLDIWMVRFILRVNKMYTYGLLSSSDLEKSERLIEVYRKYLVGGEKNKNGMLSEMNMFASQNGKAIKFGMVVTQDKSSRKSSSLLVPEINNINDFVYSIENDKMIDDKIKKRLNKLGVETRSVEERFSDLLNVNEREQYERKEEMLDILNDLGYVNETKTSAAVDEVISVQRQMAESLQNIMSTQSQTLSVVNNINTTVSRTNTFTMKNIISGVMISCVKTSLKAAVFGFAGMPWMAFKGIANFSLSGGKRLFSPFIAILSIMCFIIQMGNVSFILTLPSEDFFVPNKYSAIKSQYPLIEDNKDRFSLVNQFKTNVAGVTDVIDVSYLDFKYHSEGYKILNNMNMYNRIYHKSSKIPQIIMDEFTQLYKLKQYAFFRGYHLVIDLATNIERPSLGYKRLVDEIVGAGNVIEWVDTAAYKTQMNMYKSCKERVPGMAVTYICGKEPVFNSKLYNEQQDKQKKYLEWKECIDYNNNLGYLSIFNKRDCGKEPEKYDPTKKFSELVRKKTIGQFIWEKASLWLNPENIINRLNK